MKNITIEDLLRLQLKSEDLIKELKSSIQDVKIYATTLAQETREETAKREMYEAYMNMCGNQLINQKEIANLMDCTQSNVCKLMAAGLFRKEKRLVGKTWKVPRRVVLDYLYAKGIRK